MEKEYKRALGFAERVGSLDKNFDRLVRRDWGTEVKREIETEVSRALETMADHAGRVIEEVAGNMKKKVEEVLMTAQQAEEKREKAVKEIEANSRKRIEAVAGIVGGLDKRLGLVERFMEEVRGNLDRTYGEVQQVGRSLSTNLHEIAESERRTEKTVGQLAESLDVERISVEMANAKSTLKEVAKVIGSAAGRVQRMEVDGDDAGDGSYAMVTRGKRRTRGPTVVLEGPTSEEGKPEVTREQVARCLDPKKGDVRVRGLRKQGKDYVIELHGEEDLQKLRNNTALGEIGVKVDGTPKLRWPRVIIHDVDREIEREDLLGAVWRRNAEVMCGIEMEAARQEFIPEFVRGRRDLPARSWVVRVSPEVYKRLMRSGRVYVGLRNCRVMEFNSVSRCYRCQGLGHVQKYCRDQLVCGFCAGQQNTSKCERKDEAVSCVNCKRYGLRERNHPATWRDCPSLSVFRRRMENKTDYGC